MTPNHVSYLDAALLVLVCPRPVRFLVEREIYDLWWLGPILRASGAIPISRNDGPKEIARSFGRAREALRRGEWVGLFPEGQLTRTGTMLRFREGLERIMKGMTCPIVPVCLEGLWGSVFSFERGRCFFKLPRRVPYPVWIAFGSPLPAATPAFEVRRRVMELGAETMRRVIDERPIPVEAFRRAARRRPWRPCMADASGRRLRYGEVLTASVVLARRLRRLGEIGDNVGILLPASTAGALVNISLTMSGKVPVNLNHTVGREVLTSSAAQCGMRVVITSRAFLEKTGVRPPAEALFVEDLLGGVSVGEHLRAAVAAFFPIEPLSRRWVFGGGLRRDGIATILFTSGSTGIPKGVVLTHSNILANVEGLTRVFALRRDEVFAGVLPLFHAFGFTATLWFPLACGVGVAYHPNPLDARGVGRIVERFRATLLVATPTFLQAYLRRCPPPAFRSLRIVVTGAEKLRRPLAEAFRERFGVTPLEGYGCTELSPVVALNLPDAAGPGRRQEGSAPGSVGRPLPGVAVRIVDPRTGRPLPVGREGALLVKGPSVMRGYWRRDDLTREVLRDGWYDTGDIARIDAEGFLTITDRRSRFSKIGGEMVPHIRIEEAIREAAEAEEQVCAVTAVPDERKGERLIAVIRSDLDPRRIVRRMRAAGVPPLWIPDPAAFVPVEELPVTGSGKVDLAAVRRIVEPSAHPRGVQRG